MMMLVRSGKRSAHKTIIMLSEVSALTSSSRVRNMMRLSISLRTRRIPILYSSRHRSALLNVSNIYALYFTEDAKGAFETLANNLNEELLSNDEFLIFLLKQLSNYKLKDALSSLTN